MLSRAFSFLQSMLLGVLFCLSFDILYVRVLFLTMVLELNLISLNIVRGNTT
jgi:hypothetical protein